uniref:RING-type E3 ubiquitin transferase n=1 Tax=Portunus sp. CY-2018 TaxID=2182382 RepID=A0A2U8UG34_9EUCA|nr:ubiquitin-like protein [Portunus sp. CY-2018]
MYVKVKSMDGTQTAVLTISKLTTIDDFRGMVEEKLKIAKDRQRLFYRGKQMEDGYSMFDYNINVNDVIQLMVKPVLSETNINTSIKAVSKKVLEGKENNETSQEPVMIKESEFYRVGDLVDGKSLYDGTWWEGKIVKIVPNPNIKESLDGDDGFLYHFVDERCELEPPSELLLKHIRPRAHHLLCLKDLKPGDMIMANYNLEEPQERGHWFDCKVTRVVDTGTQKRVVATVFIGADSSPMENCHISLIDELFAVEESIKLTERTEDMERLVVHGSPCKRKNAPSCSTCKDILRRKCKECGCHQCGGKEDPQKQLMCDECDMAFHIYCLNPPLDSIPDLDEWFCPLCKNDDTEIVKAGEKLKDSKKKAKMASAKGNTSRDWGKGFACAGRQKVCTIVPQNHFGPVPGVEVGTLWKFRLQASEAGVHRPHVAGIHGRENEGAYSIVLSGGYEDDEDNGDSFTYTGSGGRDLSGNKRTAEQSSDQQLTRMNRALALNCNTAINETGAVAKNWKGGKPVRVIRNAKGRKHSKFAPEEGNRYDGIYKVVKYWQEKGKSGFKVWRYLLQRDDTTPAPWTKEGRKRIDRLGLTMQYPEGYLEAQEEKKEAPAEEENDSYQNKKAKGKKEKVKNRKRSLEKNNEEEDKNEPVKKRKALGYSIGKEIEALIGKDNQNCRMWDECKTKLPEGQVHFLSSVQDKFLCVCCQELVFQPVTTECAHNVCKTCLQRSFKAKVFTCPACRHDLGKDHKLEVNKPLSKCLLALFPGYDASR